MRELTREDFGVGPDEPFDVDAANRVFRWAMAVPEPVAKMVTEWAAWELDAAQAPQILAKAREDTAARLAALEPGLSRVRVAKHEAGESGPEFAVIDEAVAIVKAWLADGHIEKATAYSRKGYYGDDPEERNKGKFAPKGQGGQRGGPRPGSNARPRISRTQRQFQFDPNTVLEPEDLSMLSGGWQKAERAGMAGLPPADARRFQQEFRQIALQLHNAQQERGKGGSQAKLIWGDLIDPRTNAPVPLDTSRVPVMLNQADLVQQGLGTSAAEEIARGRPLIGVELLSRDDLDPGLGVASRLGLDPGRFNTGRAAAKEAGRSVTGTKQWDLPDVTAARHTTPSARRPNAGKYDAFSRASGAAGDLLAPYNPPVATALKAGAYAGRYGQNVEDMIGPTVERAAYRYRAVEKPPPADLQARLDGLREHAMRGQGHTARDGRALPPGQKAHLDFTLGWHSASEERAARDAGVTFKMGGREMPAGSPLRQFLAEKLPSETLLQLHQQAGRATPSEGVIIDRSGVITTQSVGEGSDWYLPFTAKRIKDMEGGFYGRTRLWGGPTPEDITASLNGGARGFMVQSRHGTFYVEFADDFRGARRHNDKTARMATDYEDLLDAVRSGKVKAEIHPERAREIHLEAERRGGMNEALVTQYKRQAMEEERRNPKLPESRKVATAESILDAQASAIVQSSGAEFPVEQMKMRILEGYRDEQARRYQDQGMDPQAALERAMLDAADKRDDPVWMVGRDPGMKSRYDKQVTRNTLEMRRELAAARLNGEGYAKALQGLRELYPYYFSRVEYRPGEFGHDDEKGVDGYYTRPGDTRPKDTIIGLFDAPNSNRGQVISGGDRWSKEPASVAQQRTREERPAGAAAAGQGAQGQGAAQGAQQPARSVRRDLNKLRAAFIDPASGQIPKGLQGTYLFTQGDPNDADFTKNAMWEISQLKGKDLSKPERDALEELEATIVQQQSTARARNTPQGAPAQQAATSDQVSRRIMMLAEKETDAEIPSQRPSKAEFDQLVSEAAIDLPDRLDAYRPQAPRELIVEEYNRVVGDIQPLVSTAALQQLPDYSQIGQQQATDQLETLLRSALDQQGRNAGALAPGADQAQVSAQRDAQAKQNTLIISLARARRLAERAETAKPASRTVREKAPSLDEVERQAAKDAARDMVAEGAVTPEQAQAMGAQQREEEPATQVPPATLNVVRRAQAEAMSPGQKHAEMFALAAREGKVTAENRDGHLKSIRRTLGEDEFAVFEEELRRRMGL